MGVASDISVIGDYAGQVEIEPTLTETERCGADGHPYAGDVDGKGRCWCGTVAYPQGGAG